MTSAKGRPDEIDVYVGNQVRIARLYRGLSQEKLAGALGIRFQQVQKYENGQNRVAASRLYRIAAALGREPGWFFPVAQKTAAAPAPDLSETLGRVATIRRALAKAGAAQ